MKERDLRIAVYLFLCLFSCVDSVAAAQDVAAPVEALHTALLANMKAGRTAEFDARVQQLSPVVRDSFDLAAMTRVAVGASWQRMDETERARIVEAFTAWTVATYAAQFKSWDGETFLTKGATDQSRGDVIVTTEIKPKIGASTTLNYRLRASGETWRIIDVYLDGAVSQLAMRRGEFASVLARGGPGELTAHLNQLATRLAAGG